jgi:transposase
VEVLIGVDPHKVTNVAAAIDEQGELVGQETFLANRKGVRALERWAKRFPQRRWAVEGAGGIGRPLAQKLLAAGESVVDVPPKLSSRVRVLSTGNSRKNDALDATFIALAALRNDRLASVQPEDGPEGHAEILRLLTERREDLVAERTRSLNRLHVAAAEPPLRGRQEAAFRRCCRPVVAPRQAKAPGGPGPQTPGLRAGARRARPGPEDSQAR